MSLHVVKESSLTSTLLSLKLTLPILIMYPQAHLFMFMLLVARIYEQGLKSSTLVLEPRPGHKNRKSNTETEKTRTETEKTGTEQTKLIFG